MKKTALWIGIAGWIVGFGIGYSAHPLLKDHSFLKKTDPIYAVVDGEPILESQVNAAIQSDLDEMEQQKFRLKKRATEDRIREILKARPEKDRQQARIEWKLMVPQEKQGQLANNELASQGPRSAPVELTLISNYHCAYCKEAEKRLAEMKDQYKDQVRVRYYFSLNEPDNSLVRASAEASYCAQEQNRFWAYHDAFVLHPAQDASGLIQIASDIGLSKDAFSTCLLQRKKKEALNQDLAALKRSGFSESVPGLLINGKWRAAQLPLSELKMVIDSEIRN